MTDAELKLPEGKDEKELKYQEIRYLSTVNAYQNRWDKVLESRSKLQANVIEVEVLWGSSIAEQLKNIFKHEHDLMFAITSYLRVLNPSIHEDDKKFDRENYDSKILYDTLKEETDKFRPKFLETLTPLENEIRSKLRK